MSVTYRNKSETFRLELATLFEQHSRAIYKAAYGVTRRRQDAEDVLQTVFLKLMDEPPSTEFVKNPTAYLHRCARNAALDLVRARSYRDTTGIDMDSLEVHAPNQSDHEDEMARVEAAMKEMNPQHVEVLHLRYKEGYSCREIAGLQRRSVGAVFKDLSRARAELTRRVQIQEEHGEKEKVKHRTGRKPILADASKA